MNKLLVVDLMSELDTPNVSGTGIAPIMDEVQQNLDAPTEPADESSEPAMAPRTPSRDTMRSFIHMMHLFSLRSHSTSVTQEYIKSKMIETMSRIVLDMTDADCVLVRELRSDDTSRLIGEPIFAPGKEIGYPPAVKYSAHTIFRRPGFRPTVVWDLDDDTADADLKHTIKQNLDRWPEDTLEHAFIKAIRAEVCIPLPEHGNVSVGVVAVRWQPYEQQIAKQIESSLSEWQHLLTYFYHHALRNRSCITEISQSLPRIVGSGTDSDMLRAVVTTLTCQPGLGWHRAFIFLFSDAYPSAAECVMAIGGTGSPDWSQKQTNISAQHRTLRDALTTAESPDYGSDDPLYSLVKEHPELLAIPASAWLNQPQFDAIFSDAPDPDLGSRAGNKNLALQSDDAWLRGLPLADIVMTDNAARCTHIIIPIFRERVASAIGFFLLDNPYVCPVGMSPDLPLTELVCALFAAHMSERGLGAAGWLSNVHEIREMARAVSKQLIDDPTSISFYANRRAKREAAFASND